MDEFLTTKEIADLLRIKERKVYELVNEGGIPCSRATGKILFPRRAVETWLAENSTGYDPAAAEARPNVVLGSHDPLLDWALRESGAGLATFFDGSEDGLERFRAREGVATGLHILDTEQATWNIEAVRPFSLKPVVLVEWAKRKRGLIVHPDEADGIKGLEDLVERTVVPRQPGAGSQGVLDYLLNAAGIRDRVTFTQAARTENDAAAAVADGEADATFGLEQLAQRYRLAFIPVIDERFDLLVDRYAWFEEPWQTFQAFTRTDVFLDRADDQAGYDLRNFGTVHFLGSE